MTESCVHVVHKWSAVLDCGYVRSITKCDSLLLYEVHLLRVHTAPPPQEGALPLQHTSLESLTTEKEQSQPYNTCTALSTVYYVCMYVCLSVKTLVNSALSTVYYVQYVCMYAKT